MIRHNDDFADKLAAHLKTTFNIRAWDECDNRNNGHLLNATGYELTARGQGKAAVMQKAESDLQALGHDYEGNGHPNFVMQARNDARTMAATVISFCRGPKGLH